jgi:N-hydroxyarylamine O-acetyltransferase
MFDLSAYLARIGLKEPPAADREGLLALQRAHRLSIPFENLDIFLGRPIRVDGASVFAKLVSGRRGGFCFEHNRLFADALSALGFAHRPLMGRSWLNGAEQVPPRNHTLSLLSIDGEDWIADTGFGGSYAPPMPLADGAEVTAPDGARFRLSRDADYDWMLERNGDPATTDGRNTGPGWRRQYSFDLARVFPSDCMFGAHGVETIAGGRFTTLRVVSLVLPTGFASLTDRTYKRRAADTETSGEIDDPRVYRMRLSLMFGIDLTPEDIARLGLFPA